MYYSTTFGGCLHWAVCVPLYYVFTSEIQDSKWKACWKSKNFNTVEPRLTATLVIWSPRFTAPFLATWQNAHTFLVKKKPLVNADYFFWPIVDRINEVPLYNRKTTNNIRDCKPIWTVLIKQWYNNGATVNPILTPFKAGLKEMGAGVA